ENFIDNIQGITNPPIRRLALKSGVKLLEKESGWIYEEIRGRLRIFLENAIRDVVTHAEHSKRNTVTLMDV
ncbi:hypothetical protein A3Q56_07837, partial [Intoshia linei]